MFLDSDDKLESETLEKILSSDPLESQFDAERFSYTTKAGPVIESVDAFNHEILLEQKAYYRYLYRRQFLIENRIRFLPDFIEAKGFYILDDWYFLLQFLAFKPKIKLSYLHLYYYNNHEKDIENDLRYLKQVSLEHNAYQSLGKYLKDLNNADFEFIGKAMYSRAYMICLLVRPRPGRSSRVRLSLSLLLLLSQLKFIERPRYLFKASILLLRSL